MRTVLRTVCFTHLHIEAEYLGIGLPSFSFHNIIVQQVQLGLTSIRQY